MATAAAGCRQRPPPADPPARVGRHPRRLRLSRRSGHGPSWSTRIPTPDFNAVYDQHVGQVYGFFSYRLRDQADVEDLTQQTFERALRAWGRYDPQRASPATWLLVIARNLLVDHLRSGRGLRERSLDELQADHRALAAAPDRHDLGLRPDLELALAALGDRERELIALRFGGDLSCPEIAQLTGLTLANVQQILSRSLRRMRSSLQQPRVPTRA